MSMFEGPDGNTDLQQRIAKLEQRIALLERAVRGYGIPVPVAYDGEPTEALVSPHVRQLALNGKKAEAIKTLVQETGMRLKEAGNIVDRL